MKVTSYLTSKQQRKYALKRYNQKQAESKAGYSSAKYYKDYTAEEDAFILADNGLTIAQKAEKLHRSFAAITGRRQRLLAKEAGDNTETWRSSYKNTVRKRPPQRKAKVIIRNRVKCKKCGDIIESRSVHDFRTCKCGACSVDGGHEYLRRLGNPEDWEDMSEYKQV